MFLARWASVYLLFLSTFSLHFLLGCFLFLFISSKSIEVNSLLLAVGMWILVNGLNNFSLLGRQDMLDILLPSLSVYHQIDLFIWVYLFPHLWLLFQFSKWGTTKSVLSEGGEWCIGIFFFPLAQVWLLHGYDSCASHTWSPTIKDWTLTQAITQGEERIQYIFKQMQEIPNV